MPFLTMLWRNLGSFLFKIMIASISEYMLEKFFFKIARYLASKTDTPIDDEFVDNLEKSFHKNNN